MDARPWTVYRGREPSACQHRLPLVVPKFELVGRDQFFEKKNKEKRIKLCRRVSGSWGNFVFIYVLACHVALASYSGIVVKNSQSHC